MDDEVFKQKYKKYKIRVKLWEEDFKKRNGRRPSKYDIREAPNDIRYSYKMYYKMKTSFLEDTLNDALADDGFNILEISQATGCGDDFEEDVSGLSFNGGPQLPIDIAAIVNAVDTKTVDERERVFSNLKELPTTNAIANLINRDESHKIKNFEAVEELSSNKHAWGENVSHKTIEQKKSTEESISKKNKETTSFKSNLNSKLFRTSSSFSKRNPRKSLSRTNTEQSFRDSQSSLSENPLTQSPQETLPDLETILAQKAKEQQTTNTVTMPMPSLLPNTEKKAQLPIKTHVDEGWLSRNTTDEILGRKEVKSIEVKATNTISTERKTFGLSNIDVTIFQTPKSSNVVDSNTEEVKVKKVEFEIEKLETIENDLDTKAQLEENLSMKRQYKVIKNDSDSVVSDSDGETKTEKFQHRIKRRRLLTTIVENPLNVNSNNKILSTENSKPKMDMKTNQTPENDQTEMDAMETADFSPDENTQDPDFVVVKKKTNRKTAVAKRTKSVAVKDKKEKIKVQAKTPSTKNSKRGKKQNQTISEVDNNNEVNNDEDIINPPCADDLKTTLALDGGNLTSVPRVTLTELEGVDLLANQYINSIQGITIQGSSKKDIKPNIVVNEKRAAERRKLEEKIASGRLNENFVRVNIERKRYVRGKKTFNYSKHKKAIWRNKKRVAALTGPDMDMGGCDGGVLTCFSCGQPGHFAQNCKIKGDTLLPLSAQLDDDPSPFPTLEESAEMASKIALAVHSRNISQLPVATNSAIINASNEHETKENKSVEHDDVDDSEDNSETDILMDMNDDDYDDDEDLKSFDIESAVQASLNEHKEALSPVKNYVGHKIPEDFLKMAGLDANNTQTQTSKNKVDSLYDLNDDGTVKGVTPEVMEALHMFGHTSFRKGQDKAVMRILSGLSTLVTLSTGSGKSLCYQLPAYLYSRQKMSITLVVSPLVSLMEDQVTGVPHFLRAHCLHTNQTKQQRQKIIQMINDGEVDILLVSPEAVVSGERSTGFGSILRQLPPIAFACIDEAHCVSQWSHNFRPSYLMICKVLKNNLGIKTVLGLTATATLTTRLSIITHLDIPDRERGIISDIPLPDNLVLSVSKDENRDAALLNLLNSERFEKCQSIIIYCTRRDQCDRIATYLRTCMQDRKEPEVETEASENAKKKKKRKRVAWQAEAYHAGMAASRRRVIQNAFMKNELRIVVATIAFGMGINKPDIRAVIHYNMPRNFESYVQEIGRAGRDNKLAHCHLFLDASCNDKNELRRHIYANSIDRHVIRKLLQNVFLPCSCKNNADCSANAKAKTDEPTSSVKTLTEDSCERVCPGHEIGFSIASTVESLDIPEENISTLLCYMELETRWNVNVLSSAYMKAKVISYGGPKYLKHAAKECPPLAMAIALEIKRKTFKEDANIIEFAVVDIAAAIGWNSGVVKYQLKNLEWINVNGYPQRSPITVQFIDLGFRLKAPGDFASNEIDDALDKLYERVVQQERTQLIQLQYVFQGLSSVAFNNYRLCAQEDFSLARSEQLKGIIRDYFQNDYPKDLKLETDIDSVPDEHIIDDIHCIINMYPENNFSGRTIARIFHGITSPNYPAVMWGRCKFWRSHTKSDFNRIVRLANRVIVDRRA